MKAVAPGDKIATYFVGVSILLIANRRTATVEVVDADVFNLKVNLATGSGACIIKVFEHLMLRVNHDAFTAGQILEIDTVAAASKT